MTKSDLVSQLYARYPELGRHFVEDAVSLFFSEIGNALQKNQRVELRGFGSFCLRKRDKRTGRNPKTGETVDVPEKWTPFFKAGKELRETINRPLSSSPSRRSIRQKKDSALPTFSHSLHS